MGNFFQELKRRKVFRVAAVYTVVAWLLMQVADTVLPALQMPDWTVSFITILLVLGFPIALVLAWAYELTPDGIKAETANHPSSSSVVSAHPVNYAILLVVLSLAVVQIAGMVVLNPVEVRGSGSDIYLDSGINSPAVITSQDGLDSVQRFTINLGKTDMIDAHGALGAHLALSPDGTSLAYVTQVDGRAQLYMRKFREFEAVLVPDSLNAVFPTFSPDGQYVAFSKLDGLYTVPVSGVAPEILVDGRRWYTPSWNENNQIKGTTRFAPNSYGVLEVSASGGEPEFLSAAEPVGSHFSPVSIPNSNTFLTTQVNWNPPGSVDIIAVSRESGEQKIIMSNAFSPYLSPTGHLLFSRSGAIWAVAFDPEELETIGDPVPVEEGVQMNEIDGISSYVVSDTGMLAYVRGEQIERDDRQMVWVDLNGNFQPALPDQGSFLQARLSPDGSKVAVVDLSVSETNRDIWIYDLVTGAGSRLTFDRASDHSPIWTPDGSKIVFSSDRNGGGLFWKAADGSGQVEQITEADKPQFPETFTQSGSYLVFREESFDSDNDIRSDLFLLSMSDMSVRLLMNRAITDGESSISPDGQWIAHYSRGYIYVTSFPDIDERGRWLISPDGEVAEEPIWHPSGNQIFYRNRRNGAVMVVDVDTSSGFSSSAPRLLFEATQHDSVDEVPTYSIAPGGEKFLMTTSASALNQVASDTIVVVVNNWFEKLASLVPNY